MTKNKVDTIDMKEQLAKKTNNKELLFKDLSGRLKYGVIVHHLKVNADYKVNGILINENLNGENEYLIYVNTLDKGIQMLPTGFGDVLPYLRPMFSMTEEEKYEYRHMLGATLNSEGVSIMFVYVEDFSIVMDWLNAHHFDYRDLIEEGLALEAPEGMYKTK